MTGLLGCPRLECKEGFLESQRTGHLPQGAHPCQLRAPLPPSPHVQVTRDRIMQRYHQLYPQYAFDQNKVCVGLNATAGSAVALKVFQLL